MKLAMYFARNASPAGEIPHISALPDDSLIKTNAQNFLFLNEVEGLPCGKLLSWKMSAIYATFIPFGDSLCP
jgi:hypothetical protein